jgi:hypothetical protein
MVAIVVDRKTCMILKKYVRAEIRRPLAFSEIGGTRKFGDQRTIVMSLFIPGPWGEWDHLFER